MIPAKIKGYFREALVSRLAFHQIANLMEQAGINRIQGAGQYYFKGKPSKASLVDEYFKGAELDANGDVKISEAIQLFLKKYKEPDPPIAIENLIKELKDTEGQSTDNIPSPGNPIDITNSPVETISSGVEDKEEVRDVFICHSSKDKKEYIKPFLDSLEKERITFWYDEAEIKWGDSLIKKINEGIRKSNFVIIFLSKNFVDGNWTEKEMNAALSIEVCSGVTKVLPLLIGSKDEKTTSLHKYPLLNDKKFKQWEEGIPSIVNALKERLAMCDDKVQHKITREDKSNLTKTPLAKPRISFTAITKIILLGGLTIFSISLFSIKSCNINIIHAPKTPEARTIDQEKVLLTLRYAYKHKYPDGGSFKNSTNKPNDISRPIFEGDVIPVERSKAKIYFGVANGNTPTLLNTKLFVILPEGITVTKYDPYRKISDREFNADLPPINYSEEETPLHALYFDAEPGIYPVTCTITTMDLQSKTINFKLEVY